MRAFDTVENRGYILIEAQSVFSAVRGPPSGDAIVSEAGNPWT